MCPLLEPHPKSWSRSLPPIPHRRSEAVGTALVDDRSSVYPTSDLTDSPDEDVARPSESSTPMMVRTALCNFGAISAWAGQRVARAARNL